MVKQVLLFLCKFYVCRWSNLWSIFFIYKFVHKLRVRLLTLWLTLRTYHVWLLKTFKTTLCLITYVQFPILRVLILIIFFNQKYILWKLIVIANLLLLIHVMKCKWRQRSIMKKPIISLLHSCIIYLPNDPCFPEIHISIRLFI